MNDAQKTEDISRVAGKWMLNATWVILLVLLTWFFNHQLDKRDNPNSHIQTQADNQSVVLKRNYYGHYVSNGYINEHPVSFFIDTGATHVAMGEDIAQQLGLNKGRKTTVETANGTAPSYATRLDSIRLGHIIINDVRASINPGMNGQDHVLLGMSFLRHLEFSQRGDTLILHY